MYPGISSFLDSAAKAAPDKVTKMQKNNVFILLPNAPGSATRPAGGVDSNRLVPP